MRVEVCTNSTLILSHGRDPACLPSFLWAIWLLQRLPARPSFTSARYRSPTAHLQGPYFRSSAPQLWHKHGPSDGQSARLLPPALGPSAGDWRGPKTPVCQTWRCPEVWTCCVSGMCACLPNGFVRSRIRPSCLKAV